MDTASVSDSDSDRGMDCLPQTKRLLLDKCYISRKASSLTSRNTPASSRRPVSRLKFLGSLQTTTSSIVSNNNLRIARVSDPIGVFCRLRPWGTSDEERCVRILDEKQILLTPPDTSVAWKLGNAKKSTYSFQHVFGPEIDQPTMFQRVALPLVEDVLKGRNALLFAYGVTGSGKTYTMSGNTQDSGIMPRSLDVIFNSIAKFQARKYVFKPDKMNGFDVQSQVDAMHDKQKELAANTKTPRSRIGTRNTQVLATPSESTDMVNRIKDPTVLPVAQEDYLYSVFVTYVEIYNNFVYDLLDESTFDEWSKKISLQAKMLREDASKNVYVNGGTEIEVSSSEEAFEVFNRGQRRRKQAHTCLNTESSRSHAIFNVRIVQAPLDANGEDVLDTKLTVSQLSLVDLAGSVRYGRTGGTGDRLKKAGKINNSLMTLRKCMDVLRENQRNAGDTKPPFRNTKLTHYLKSYFEGEGSVRMIICLNPRSEDYDESIHVMTFAELTPEVQITQPQERKPDPLTPGRRKINEIFKEANLDLLRQRYNKNKISQSGIHFKRVKKRPSPKERVIIDDPPSSNFRCGCGKFYLLKQHFVRHQKSHDPEFKCTKCGYVFTRIDNLSRHSGLCQGPNKK